MAFDLKRLVRKTKDQLNVRDNGKTWQNPQGNRPVQRTPQPASTGRPSLGVAPVRNPSFNQAPVRQQQIRPQVQVARPKPLNVGRTPVMPTAGNRTGVKGSNVPKPLNFAGRTVDVLARGASRTADQVNAYDNGRTWQNRKPTNTRSILGQATHNGTTNTIGNIVVKPIVATAAIPVEAGRSEVARLTKNKGAYKAAEDRLNTNVQTSLPGVIADQVVQSTRVAKAIPATVGGIQRGFQGKAPTPEQKAAQLKGLGAFNRTVMGMAYKLPGETLGNVLPTAKEDLRAAGVEDMSLAQQAGTSALGVVGMLGAKSTAVGAGRVTTKLVKPPVQAAKDIITNKPYRKISDQELNGASNVRNAMQGNRNPFDITDQDVQGFEATKRRLGADGSNPNAIDQLVIDRAKYDTRQANRGPLLQPLNQGGYVRIPGRKTELMATHNLSEDNLSYANKLGGIPQASVGIVDPKKHAVDGFGEITLIGNQKLVDPKAPKTATFASDVYSPRQPRAKLSGDRKVYDNLKAKFKASADEIGQRYVGFDSANSLDEAIANEPAVIAQFLKSKGIKVKAPETTEIDKLDELQRQIMDANLGQAYTDNIVRLTELGASKGKFSDTVDFMYKNNLEPKLPTKIKPIDRYELMKAVRGAKLEDEFDSFTKKTAQEAGAKPTLYNGTDYQGRPKELPETMDNVLKVMRKDKIRAGEGGMVGTGIGNIRARITPKFKSLEDIYDNKHRLTDAETMESVKDLLSNRMTSVRDKLNNYATNKDGNQFMEYDTQMDAIGDYLRGDKSWFNDKFKNVPDSVLKELEQVKKEIQDAPTEYFESVSDRAVGLKEFEKALVPESASQATINSLKSQGIEPIIYKDGQRQAMLNKLMDEDNIARGFGDKPKPRPARGIKGEAIRIAKARLEEPADPLASLKAEAGKYGSADDIAKDYAGQEFTTINTHVKGRTLDQMDRPVAEKVKALDGRMTDDIPKGTYYRGMVLLDDEIEAMLKSKQFKNDGYSSVSDSAEVAKRYTYSRRWGSPAESPVIFNLDVGDNQKGIDLTKLSGESARDSEKLLPRNADYTVKNVTKEGDTYIVEAIYNEATQAPKQSIAQKFGLTPMDEAGKVRLPGKGNQQPASKPVPEQSQKSVDSLADNSTTGKTYTADEVNRLNPDSAEVFKGNYVKQSVPLSSLDNASLTRQQLIDSYGNGHSEKSLASLAKGGDISPIVLDTKGNVLDGMHRIVNAKEQGRSNIEAFVQVNNGSNSAKPPTAQLSDKAVPALTPATARGTVDSLGNSTPIVGTPIRVKGGATEKQVPVSKITKEGDRIKSENVNPNIKRGEKRFALDDNGEMVADTKGAYRIFTDDDGHVTQFRVGNEVFKASDLGDLSSVNGYGSALATQRRNIERAFPKETADKVTAFTVDHQQAQATKMIARKITLKKEMKALADDLGINFAGNKRKAKKVSAAIQDFGEKKIDRTQLNERFGREQATKIVNADKWFRKNYDSMLDEMNTVLKEFGYPEVPKRADYYTHFQEPKLWESFGLKMKEIRDFASPTLQDSNPNSVRGGIDNKLAGESAFTNPNKAFNKYALRRKGDERTADAFQAFERYMTPTLNNIYMTPSITRARVLAKAIAEEANIAGKDANGTLIQIKEWANNLAGKTNGFDRRAVDTKFGNAALRAAAFVQRRAGGNSIVGNLATAALQPIVAAQAVGKFGPKNFMVAAMQEMGTAHGKNAPIRQAEFLFRRYGDLGDNVTDGKIAKGADIANTPLRVVEQTVARITWNAAHNDAISKGMTGKKAMHYADVQAEKTLAGRSIGEKPEFFNSKMYGPATMYQLEVANYIQQVGREMTTKQVLTTFAAAYAFNLGLEEMTGRQVGFNPIDAAIDAYQETEKEGKDKLAKTKAIGQRFAGEAFDNTPFVGQIANFAFGEKGTKWLGPSSNAGRFGVSSPLGALTTTTKIAGVQVPLNAILPFGGAQIKKTYEGAQAMAAGKTTAKDGTTTVEIPQNFENWVKALAFGKNAVKEVNTYNSNMGKKKEDQQVVPNQKDSKASTQGPKKLIETRDEDGLVNMIGAYASAIKTSPTTAFERIVSGQTIRRTNNGAIIVERLPGRESDKIKRQMGGDSKDLKLDHTIPLQLGGSNNTKNLKLVPTDEWSNYTPVENYLGKQLRTNKITANNAEKLITDFKAGKITAEQVYEKTGMKEQQVAAKAKASTERSEKLKASLSAEDYKLNQMSKADKQTLVDNGKVPQAKVDGLTDYVKDKKQELGYKAPAGTKSTVATGITPHSKKVLDEYAKLDPATRKNKEDKEPSYEWKVGKSKLENDKASGKLTGPNLAKREQEVKKLDIGKVYSKEARDLFGKKKQLVYDYVTGAPNGQKLAEQLVDYEKRLFEAGLIDYTTFQKSIAPLKGGSKGGSKTGRTSGGKGSRGGRTSTGRGSRGGKTGSGIAKDFSSILNLANRTASSNQSAVRNLVYKNRIKAKKVSRVS